MTWSLLAVLVLAPSCVRPDAAPPPAASGPSAPLEALEPDVRAALEHAAGSLDVALRQRATWLLVRYAPEPGGGDRTVTALADPSPYVQRRTVEALGERLPEPAALEILREVAADPDRDAYTRGEAGLRLALAGDRDTLASFQEALEARLPRYEQAPLALAAAAMGDPAALEQLADALAAGDFPLELTFFADCGRSGLTELAGPLAVAAPRQEEELHLPIASALVQLGSADGARLFRAALADPSEELRLEAVDFLRQLDGDVASDLLKQASNGGPGSVRRYADLVLVARGEQEAGELVDLLGSPDREERQQALWALSTRAGQLGGDDTEDRRLRRDVHLAAVAAVADPEYVVVVEALRALGRVGGPDDIALLRGMLEAELGDLRVEAAAAMLALSGSRASAAG